MYTPAAEAARRIADAIIDDDATLRVGSDDLSEGMLEGWRNAGSDEAWLRPLLAGFPRPRNDRSGVITGLAHRGFDPDSCVADVDWRATISDGRSAPASRTRVRWRCRCAS